MEMGMFSNGMKPEDMMDVVDICSEELARVKGIPAFMAVIGTLIDQWAADTNEDFDDIQAMLKTLPEIRALVREINGEMQARGMEVRN